MAIKPVKKKPLKVPYVDWFPDYHDIEFELEDLQKVWENISAKEIAFDGHNYWGVFYETGK